MKKVCILCLVLVIGIFTGMGILTLFNPSKSEESYHYLVSEHITLQQAKEECNYIEITEEEEQLLQAISNIRDIKDAMKKVDATETKDFPTEIIKDLSEINVLELTVLNNSIIIDYILDSNLIMLNYLSSGEIYKHVNKIITPEYNSKDNQYCGYINFNNKDVEKETLRAR